MKYKHYLKQKDEALFLQNIENSMFWFPQTWLNIFIYYEWCKFTSSSIKARCSLFKKTFRLKQVIPLGRTDEKKLFAFSNLKS